jgi:hypothetical protein
LRLADAWKALNGLSGDHGWRSTHLATIGPSRVLAARQMPGNREALLLGFQNIRLSPASELPSGKGFLVETLRDPSMPTLAMLALSRQPGASLGLFEAMAHDLVSLLFLEEHEVDALVVVSRVIERIRAWQDFMLRDRSGVLDEEDEVGLHGELYILSDLIEELGDANVAVDAWKGPLHGLHDFILPIGAIEVKSTVSTTGFRATVSSLDQLDPAVRSPLHVAAVRLVDDATGATLPERIAMIRQRTLAAPLAAQAFSMRLLRFGYIDAMAAHYTRRLRVADVRLFAVSGAFPVLTFRSVPAGVVSARYIIDLDAVALPATSLADVLRCAGSPP